MLNREERDAELISALSVGLSPEQAALRAGCACSTVYRRLKDPDFVARLDAVKDRLGALPEDMAGLFNALHWLRKAEANLKQASTFGLPETTVRSCMDSLERAIVFLEEWCWLREIEPLEAAA